MPPDKPILDWKTIAELFPFHLLVDSVGSQVLSVGNGLSKILSRPVGNLRFDEAFTVTRPNITELSWGVVKENLHTSFVLKIESKNASLKGQFVLTAGNDLLFVGSLLVECARSLEDLDVNLNIFPPFDLTPDVVILHKFREMQIQDQQKRMKQLTAARDELGIRANTDELTNVANRRGFWETGSHLLLEHKADESGKAVLLLLDLDEFKSINDLQGHEAGDLVLREAASRLSFNIGSPTLVGRLGGDEFVVLLILDESTDENETVENLIGRLTNPLLDPRINASVGATLVGSDNDLEKVIGQADLAMYEGRVKSRGNISWYTIDLELRQKNHNKLQEKVSEAIKKAEIVPQFQPIISLGSNTLVSFEALARWSDPDLGIVPPDVFITVAGELGLLRALDRQILEMSLDQLTVWHHHNRLVTVHVNLSTASLTTDLVDTIVAALEKHKIDSEYLVIELTETTILENVENAAAVLEQLAEIGVKFQLDDFGTGYSSLAHLKNLPVSGIKIDRSFVSDALENEKSKALLLSVVGIAEKLNLNVVAEGIENLEQLEFLTEIGCQYGQGFFIGRPAEPGVCEAIFPQLRRKVA